MDELRIRDGVVEAYLGREAAVTVPEGVHTIGRGAFKACVSVKKIVLPAGLRRIEAEAFKGCRNLAEAVIPEGVSYIGDYGFHRCHSLERIALPASVTELGECVFLYCDSLEEAQIPGVRHLGAQVFVNDVSLRRLVISGALEEGCICDVFTGCGALEEIVFAESGEQCRFSNAVEAVAGKLPMPRLVRAVAVDVLRMMELEGRCMVTFRTNLKHVDIPEGIESIGKSCFFDKRGILSVKFPRSLKEIGSRAFRNCINLEKVVFEGDTVCVHEDAFRNCSSLKTICMPGEAQYELKGIGGLGVAVPEQVRLIEKQVLGNFRISGSILLKYLGEESRVAVPEGITLIAEEAFAGNESVDRVLLPESLREIGAGAFRDCVLLQSVEFPEKLLRIGAGAFENCVKLLRAKLPGRLTEVGAKTFKRCRALKEISFGKDLLRIGEQAFYGCGAVREVTFPEGLGFLGEMAFCRCGGLRTVSLLPGTEYVENLAFAQSGVRRVRISGGGQNYGAGVFSDCTRLTSLVLEEGVCHIADKMCYGCTALEEVQLPGSLRSVGRNVWERTPFLEKWLREGAEKAEIFWDGRNLEGEVRLPGTVRIVAGGAFYGNKKVTGLELPESVRWVGPAAFKGCSGLRQVFWAAGDEAARGDAARDSAGKDSAAGDDAIKGSTAGGNAAKDGAAGDEVSGGGASEYGAGDGGYRLEAEAFSGCTQLEQVTLWCRQAGEALEGQGSIPQETQGGIGIPPAAREGAAQDGAEGIGSGTCSLGLRILPWRYVGERAFYRCGSLREICLEDGAEIGKEAFWGCGRLRFLFCDFTGKCPDMSVSDCADMAHQACPDMSVSDCADMVPQACPDRPLPNCPDMALWGKYDVLAQRCTGISGRLSWIGENAFEGTLPGQEGEDGPAVVGTILVSGKNCGGRLYLPEGITGIAPFAFSGNKKVTGVVLPESLQRIGEGAFWGCSGLEEVRFPRNSCRVHARAFQKCTALREVRLRAGQLGEGAFAYCISLKRAEIDGRSMLPTGLFEGCRALEECVCPGVRAVQAGCFSGCVRLERFDLSRIYVVRERAFSGCGNLRRALFAQGACIGAHAFEDCWSLEEIGLLGQEGELQLREYAFLGCTALVSVTLQGRAWRFGSYGDILDERIPETVRLIFHSAMSCFAVEKEENLVGYRGNAKRVRIPEGIRRIGAEVFRDALALEEIAIPDSVEYIGARAFHGTAWMERQRELSPMVTVNHMLLDGSGCRGMVEVDADIRLVCGWAFANGLGIEGIRFCSEFTAGILKR